MMMIVGKMRRVERREKNKEVMRRYIEYNVVVIIILVVRGGAIERGMETKSVIYRIIRMRIRVVLGIGRMREHE